VILFLEKRWGEAALEFNQLKNRKNMKFERSIAPKFQKE